MSTITEDFSPITQGDTLVPFAPTFQHKDGSAVNLTGATITMKMVDTSGLNAPKTCSGTWTIDNATAGQAHYGWQSADVNTPGIWELSITITVSGQFVHGDAKLLEILAAP